MIDRLGPEIERELARFADRPPAQLAAIVAAWPSAVGETIAANAWPARLSRDGTLHVHASSSTWAFELGQLSSELLARLREHAAESAPKAIRFALGHLPEGAVEAADEPKREVPAPGPQEVARAAELSAGIDDEDLRKTVAKAAALSLARGAADRGF